MKKLPLLLLVSLTAGSAAALQEPAVQSDGKASPKTEAPSSQPDDADRVEMPGQLVVSLKSKAPLEDFSAVVGAWDLASIEANVRINSVRKLFQWQRRGEVLFTNVFVIEFSPAGVDVEALRAGLSRIEGVNWVAPNVGFTGDVQDLVPNDPQFNGQYHHVTMQNEAAWDITLGDASIIMGITDDGVDIDHEDLEANIWVNAGEIAGDGIDNDGNGFVDDVNGFDFVNDNADPNPNVPSNDHGTHVAGIAGARTNNAIGLAGTAGAATIMPLQFYSSDSAWTAVDVAEAFAYGADNGAQIISMSYNLNRWVGDPLVTAAFDYIYDQGVLHFNSGGNSGELNPSRQSFHQTFLVASTENGDTTSGFTNYGTGMDVTAPGSSILSTILNDQYGLKSGTSMAAPNAAGVAALIWSSNPGWTRDQVAAQLYFTADNIDALNPSRAGLLGGGRVNSFRALTETIPPPQLASAAGLPAEGAALVGNLGSIVLRFDQVLDPAAVNAPGAFALVYAGADGTIGTADDIPVALDQVEYLIGANEVRMTPVGSLPAGGLYRFTADGALVQNPFSTALDGDGDGFGGDSWERTFEACATIEILVDNAESGVDWSVVNQNLDSGSWTASPEVPIGGGVRSDPANDFDGSGRCFVTENAPGNTDVDGGPTRLISRAFDLGAIADPYLSFAAWIVSSGGDPMLVDLSNDDGTTWTSVQTITGTDGWEVFTFRVADVLAPTATTRLRWSVTDANTPSVTEAGIDFIRVLELSCGDPGIGSTYCVTSPNSAGAGATIRAEGSTTAADNDFSLIAESVPAGQFGLFFFGPDQVQVPLGNGSRCVGGALVRMEPSVNADGFGVARLDVDLSAVPAAGAIVSGANLNFQFWFRDSVGAGSNLSDAVNIVWQ